VKEGAAVDERSDLLERARAALSAEFGQDREVFGSWVEPIEVDADRVLIVRLSGACQGCASSTVVVVGAIESALRARVPEIRFVEPAP
jgi:Fe-S cluster biogenesis protein NfuA